MRVAMASAGQEQFGARCTDAQHVEMTGGNPVAKGFQQSGGEAFATQGAGQLDEGRRSADGDPGRAFQKLIMVAGTHRCSCCNG
ncbi:hypothetical protein P4133_25915 [Pseudomonas aeruginosa]|nr:hypothetical protein [Pseudomonas aeruginosa]